MDQIPTSSWIAGLTGSLLFLIFGWPLANALAGLRVIFGNYYVKLIAVACVGAASAPMAEAHAPGITSFVAHVEQFLTNLPDRIS